MLTKTNTTDALKAAMDAVEGLTALSAKQKQANDDAVREGAALRNTIDLADPDQVARMSYLLAIESVGNDRRLHLAQELDDAQTALVLANRQFAQAPLGPRCRDLEARALARVEKKLRPLFPDADSLRTAAFGSTELQALRPIWERVTIQDYGLEAAVRVAKGLLQAWADADAFERKHLS